MGSSSQIALFVAPVLVILSYFIAPAPMDLNFGGGQVLMVLLTTLTVSLASSRADTPRGTRASSSWPSTPFLP